MDLVINYTYTLKINFDNHIKMGTNINFTSMREYKITVVFIFSLLPSKLLFISL